MFVGDDGQGKKPSHIATSIFPGWSFISNYEVNILGRIWIVGSAKARLTPIFKIDQMITSSVLLEGKEEEFFCSFVYAYNFSKKESFFGKTLEITTTHHYLEINLG